MSKTRKETVHAVLKDGRWHDGYDLCHPDVGGTSGLRRVRELRADGVGIEKRKKPGSNTYQYRWDFRSECSCLWEDYGKSEKVMVADEDCAAKPHPRIDRA